MGAATEPTTMTDMFLKATEGNGLETSYNMFLEVEKYECIEMETLWRNMEPRKSNLDPAFLPATGQGTLKSH
ncbi:hypothetical protein AV530_007454 [Patagioenas fasciata monilis]|uniref:Uncharacterized protein n=1 Tax=Patagioenas fasciata monilis TaxID=372326 RepID=A0A1V4JXT5_PATFA|nr:hypothetical protein AV530_007454 [Patagioenas fasciata monilis]